MPPPHRVTTRPADARERLLDAAERLMWERGYEAVGVAEICTVAGAPRGSFYHWWPSKQALALATIERSWERVRTLVIEPSFRSPGTLAERLDRYVAALVANLAAQLEQRQCVPGCRFGNLAAELSTRDEDVRAAVERVFDELCGLFAAAIAEARDTGEVPPGTEPEGAALALCAHMEGLMLLAKARRDPSLLQRLRIDAAALLSLHHQRDRSTPTKGELHA